MSKIEELIPIKIREKIDDNFKLTIDTAKMLYFELNCNLSFVNDELKRFFLKFSNDELLSWNNEYYKFMDIKLNYLYNQDISIDNLIEYSSILEFMSYIYTDSKNNYILYISYLKKYIKKYGYIMFYGIEGTNYDDLKQYALPWLFKVFMFDIDQRFLLLDNQNRITLHKMFPTLDKYGLIPLFIHLGYKDLLQECLYLINESLNIDNILNDQIIMEKLNIKFLNSNLISMLEVAKKERIEMIESYLKAHKCEI